MKAKFIFSVALSAICLSSGCSLNSYSNNDYNNPPVNSTITPMQAKVDAKILGSMIVLNKNEIAAASTAQRKASNPSVKKYAAWIYNEHTKNLQETQNISRRIGVMPENGNVAGMLQRKGTQEMATLNRLSNKAFDKAYISAMVRDHAAALQLLNHKLLNQTSNPLLRKHLEITRSHIVAHLQQAKLVQREIANS